MDAARAAGQQHLTLPTECGSAMVAAYGGAARRFIAWRARDVPTCRPAAVTVFDAKAKRPFRLAAGLTPAPINRALRQALQHALDREIILKVTAPKRKRLGFQGMPPQPFVLLREPLGGV